MLLLRSDRPDVILQVCHLVVDFHQRERADDWKSQRHVALCDRSVAISPVKFRYVHSLDVRFAAGAMHQFAGLVDLCFARKAHAISVGAEIVREPFGLEHAVLVDGVARPAEERLLRLLMG